jgi:hypothetical protein
MLQSLPEVASIMVGLCKVPKLNHHPKDHLPEQTETSNCAGLGVLTWGRAPAQGHQDVQHTHLHDYHEWYATSKVTADVP